MDKEKLIQDMARVRFLTGQAVQTGDNLVSLSFRESPPEKKLRQDLETVVRQFERSTLELRQICEKYAEPIAPVGKKLLEDRRDNL